MTVAATSSSTNCPPPPTCNTPTWKITSQNSGSATTGGTMTIKLDNGYELQFSENNSQIKIINNCTTPPEVTTIWGDPHVDWNGQAGDEGRFFGNTSFVLADGTKITVNTVPYNNGNEWLANNVVVTKGDQALIVDGLAQTTKGDFKVYQGMNGKALDKLVDDGKLTVYENANGIGWVTEKGGCTLATQADFNKTKVDNCNPNKPADLCKQLETLYGCGKPGGGGGGDCDDGDDHGGGGKKCCPSWLEIIAGKWGDLLDCQAKKLEELAKKLQECTDDKLRPSITQELTVASQQFQLYSTQAMTMTNSLSTALQSLARAG
ncbi:MAG: DUF1521 domain-containing protein [Burkholderiales bacterium]